MPLVRIDMTEGRSDDELKTLLDTAQECAVDALEVPERDRYQIVTEHKPGRMILLDTGLGFERTEAAIVVQVFTSPRETTMKEKYCKLMADRLQTKCDLDPKDLFISFMTNTDVDWSFGYGEIQYLNGKL